MSTVTAEQLAALADPVVYARVRLGLDLYPWQEDALRAMAGNGSRVAVRTCNEAGKTSFLVSALVLWHMETFLGSLTVTTSGSYNQIVNQLYPHLQGWAVKLGGGLKFGDCWGEHPGTGSRLVSFSTNNEGRAEGWHEGDIDRGLLADNPLKPFGVDADTWEKLSENVHKSSLMLIIDEAKSVQDGIYDAFERCHATRWINVSSPGIAAGRFYECFNKDSKNWKGFRVQANDCPHLWDNPAKRAELEQQMIRMRPALVQSMIYGEFMTSGEGLVFDVERIQDAFSGRLPKWGKGHYRRGALDLSAGGDEIRLGMADGNCIRWLYKGFEKDDKRLVDILIPIMRMNGLGCDEIVADDGGVGKIILNEFQRRGFPLRRFNFGAGSRDKKLYANARAEMYFKAADFVKQGWVNIDPDDVLLEEAGFVGYVVDSMPLKLPEKSKYPRSPNALDVLCMLLYDMPEPGQFKQERKPSILDPEEESGGSGGYAWGE